MLPKDPHILISVINSHLRDHHVSLEDFCKTHQYDQRIIETTLEKVNFHYDANQNQFK